MSSLLWDTGAFGALANPLCRGPESSCPETQWRQQKVKIKRAPRCFTRLSIRLFATCVALAEPWGLLDVSSPLLLDPSQGGELAGGQRGEPSCSYFLLPLPTRRLCSSISVEGRSFLLIKRNQGWRDEREGSRELQVGRPHMTGVQQLPL